MKRLQSCVRALLVLGLTVGVGASVYPQSPGRATATEGQSGDKVTLALVGGRLIDGYGGPPVEDSVVLIAGNRIQAIGQLGRLAIPEGATVISTEGMTVLPGLIDLHVHFDIIGHNDYGYWFPTYKDRMRSLVLPLAAKQMVEAGVTSARDLGANIEDIFWIREQIRTGKLPGPRVFLAGPFLRKSVNQIGQTRNDTWVIENPDDARAKVRKLVELGVDVIKTQDDSFSVEEFRAIYEEARKLNKRVATHLLSTKPLHRVIAAGIGRMDTIEHIGTGPEPEFPPDVVQGIVEGEVGCVPTEIAIDGFRQLVVYPEFRDHPRFRNSYPPEIWPDIRRSYEDIQRHPLFHESVFERAARVSKLRQLKRAGARFYLGTDSGTRGNPHHAAAWREMVGFVEFGLTPMETIVASTQGPAQVLGRARELGTIAPGKLADLIVVDGDPLTDMRAMERVEMVIKDGKRAR